MKFSALKTKAEDAYARWHRSETKAKVEELGTEVKAKAKAKAEELGTEVKSKAEGLGAEVKQAFTEHPQATGETYLEHLWFTLRMSARMFWAGFAILMHGIFPFLFTKTGSNEIAALYAIMKNRIPASKLLESYEQFRGSNI